MQVENHKKNIAINLLFKLVNNLNFNMIRKKITGFIIAEMFFLFTFLAVTLKSAIFLGFVTGSHTKIHLIKGFDSIRFPWYFVFFILVILSICFLFKGKGRNLCLLVINIIVSLLFFMDILYFRAFGTFLNPHMLKEVGNLSNLSDSVISFTSPWDIFFFLDFPFFIVALVWFRKSFANQKIRLIAFLALFMISAGYLLHIPFITKVLGHDDKMAYIFDVTWRPDLTLTRLSPIGYHLNDLIVYLNDCKKLSLSSKEVKDIKEWFEEKNEHLPDNKYMSMFKGKNLIYIQVESLENFVIGRKVYGQEITPNINKLLQNSLYFNEIEEQVNMGTSSDSDLMVNTSVYPVRRGSTFFRYPNNTYNSMPVLMGKMGYSTLAIHPDKGSYWNWMEALKSIGFNRCIDASQFAQDDIIGLGLSDESYFKQVKPIIIKQKQPFYTFMVTLSSHSPFNLPKRLRTMSIPEKIDETKIGGYFQSVHYTDKQIGDFISALDKEGLLNNTVIALSGDHCGVHKFYQADITNMEEKEAWWSDNYNYVPFIIYSKGSKGEQISTRGGQIDFMPTLLYLMGANQKDYINTAMGRNLLNTKRDFAILANGNRVGNIYTDDKEKQSEIKGLELADTLIRSNYFKDHN
ncbi:MAG: LTA synthase family protein [Bacillota bacterium]|nr:LTA synthase family protein [Bacillota bacterium]